MEEALDLNIALDEPDVSILDKDDNVKPPIVIGLDKNTPCFVKRYHFLTNDKRQSLVHDFINRVTEGDKLKNGSILYELMDQYAISECMTRRF